MVGLLLTAPLLFGGLMAPSGVSPSHAQDAAETPDEDGGAVRTRPDEAVVAWIEVTGALDQYAFDVLEMRVQRALELKPRFIVFSVEATEGDYRIGPDLAGAIERLSEEHAVTTIGYLRRSSTAVSTMLAFACDEIAMRETSSIGGCELLNTWFGGVGNIPGIARVAEGEPAERWRSTFKSLAARQDEVTGSASPGSSGPWQAIAEGMIEPDTTVYRVVLEDGTTEIATERTVDDVWRAAKRRAIASREAIGSGSGYLLLSGKEALENGIARYLVEDEEALLAELAAEHGFEASAVRAVPIDSVVWEPIARFLNQPLIRVLLLALGIVGLVLSILVQGTGVPEVLTVVCFTLFFLSGYILGLAGWIEIVLFAIGVVLLFVEIFVTPGFAVLGGTGVVLVLASIVLAMQSFAFPATSAQWTELGVNIGATFVAGFVGIVICGVALRFLPRRAFGGLVNEQSAAGYDVSIPALAGLEGKRGVASTVLRPAGKVEIGDALIDVTTEGEYIHAGDPVVVLRVEGNRVVVGPPDAAPPVEPSADAGDPAPGDPAPGEGAADPGTEVSP